MKIIKKTISSNKEKKDDSVTASADRLKKKNIDTGEISRFINKVA